MLTSQHAADRCPSCFVETRGAEPCPDCRSIERPRVALALGTKLLSRRYAIGRVLGKPGGFGITYLAWDAQLKRRVAIKEFFPPFLVSREADAVSVSPQASDLIGDLRAGLRSFLEEARTLAACQHDGIVAVIDFAEENGTAYIVMPYHEGQTLDAYIAARGGRLPWAEATHLMLQVLDALEALHAVGLIHRDIKPNNIYLARDARGESRPIVIDFGAARWATASRKMTIILTEGFAPLEQYDEGQRQGPWTDVYAVAATLYAAITGAPPPSALARIQTAHVRPLDDIVPGVPAALAGAVAHGLDVEAEVRPQSARAFATSLRSLVRASDRTTMPLGPQAVPTVPMTRRPPSWRLSRRLLAGAVATVVVAGGIAAVVMSRASAGVGASPGATGAAAADTFTVALRAKLQRARTALDAGNYATAVAAAGEVADTAPALARRFPANRAYDSIATQATAMRESAILACKSEQQLAARRGDRIVCP